MDDSKDEGSNMTGRPRSDNPKTAPHSIRTTDSMWTEAKLRAENDGTTVNAVLNMLLEGYATGQLDLPQVTKTWSPFRVGEIDNPGRE